MKIDQAKIKSVPKELEAQPALKTLSGRVSLFQEGNRYEIVYVKIEAILPFKHQSRKSFDEDELNALAQTIKDHGIRQPLTLLGKPDDTYEVISGERRLRAAKIVGLSRVPAIVVYDEKSAEEIALIENIQRADLTPLELGEGLLGLLKRGVFDSQAEMARNLGLQRTKVSEAISLTRLSPTIKDLVTLHKINNRDWLRQLLSAHTEEEQITMIKTTFLPEEGGHPFSKIPKKVHLSAKSILRIIKDKKGVRVQNFDMSGLDDHEKKEVRASLEHLLALFHEEAA